jgi:hypothetical protein
MTGSLRLREYPDEIVRLSCPKCGRAGQYRKQSLIERHGADMRLPDLRVTHHAGVVHESAPLTLRNFFSRLSNR